MAKIRKKAEGAPTTAGDTTAANPDRERVATRAYELYLARGGGDGRAMEDWLLAERELLTNSASPTPPRRKNAS
jgi:hypothetical protein